jgi:hypothetical protein
MQQLAELMVIRLILRRCAYPQRGQYDALREDTGEHVLRSHQPLCDGARELIRRGEAPEVLVTIRHAGAACDSITPAPLGYWVKYTYTEGLSTPLRRQKWKPRPNMPATPLRTPKHEPPTISSKNSPPEDRRTSIP